MGYPPPGAYPQPGYAAWYPPYGQQFPSPGVNPAACQPQAPVAPGTYGIAPSCDSCTGNGCGITGWQFFGESLYLRARGAEVPYAVPISGPIVAPPSYPVQVGRVASTDPEYQPGFRAGLARAFDECSSLRATYTFYESETSDRVTLPGASSYVLRSLVSHPGTWTVASDGLDGQAHQDIDFQIADVDYRSVFLCGPRYELAYVAGVKYVHLEQEFGSQFDVLGTELVNTRINFDGAGIRVGLEGERRAHNCGLLVYGRTSANFVAGEFHANYFQADGSRGTLVNTGMTTSRVISILDLELGVGWASPDDCIRLTAGYMVSGWFNTLLTDDWIRGVHNNSFGDLSDTLTFDGFTARAEIRF
ncbi:MAG: Lpg1974 family pore-forming outer membrane protein [Thermoguttaceae bacterium]|jgi:hypothetical protein